MINPHSPAVKTYGLRAPAETHRRSATCEEFGCLNFRNGFAIRLDPIAQDRLAADVRRLRAGRFAETSVPGGVLFTFEPGTPCFTAHTTTLDRPPLYVVRDFQGARRHANGRDWVDDFQENQIKLIEKIQEG